MTGYMQDSAKAMKENEELRSEIAILDQHAKALRFAIRECIINHGDYIGSQLFSDMYDLIGGEEALK